MVQLLLQKWPMVVFKRPAEDDGRLAFRLDALLDLFLDDARRRPHADILPRLFPAGGRQRAQIPVD